MRFTSLQVERFGTWLGLSLENLDPGVNVFFGPNEAGKTTLLEFVRSLLYGFGPQRSRYLDDRRIAAEPCGGWIGVDGPQGVLRLSRHADPGDASAAGPAELETPERAEHDDRFLSILLGNVDEATFNNVFAIGLHELQELATLSDTEAADLLFKLAAGLDRVSLVEVMRELDASRRRILAPPGQSCMVGNLLAQRDRLQAEVAESQQAVRRYERLSAERGQLDREIDAGERESSRLQAQLRAVDVALGLGDRWRLRTELDQQLAGLGPVGQIPEGALSRLDRLSAAAQRRQASLDALGARRQELQAERDCLAVNDALCRQAQRIEALQEQKAWIQSLQEQIVRLQQEFETLQSQVEARRRQLGIGDDVDLNATTTVSPRAVESLRLLAGQLRRAGQNHEAARQSLAAARDAAKTAQEQFDSALAATGHRDLEAVMQRLGEETSQLRRRVQIDERLQKAAWDRTELEQQGRDLLEQQLMPMWVILALGGVFTCGVVLVVAGLFMPASVTGSVGWAMAVLGLLGTFAGGMAKVMLERSHQRQSEACRTHLQMLQSQAQQLKEERDLLDRQLPRGGGPLAIRLEKAEKQLAQLEALTPLESQSQSAREDLSRTEGLAAQAARAMEERQAQWRDALGAAGLPRELSPKQVRAWARNAGRLGTLLQRLARTEDEYLQRQSELETLSGRIAKLLTETGLGQPPSSEPLGQLEFLTQSLAQQEGQLRQRRSLTRQLRQVHRKQGKLEGLMARLNRRRRSLLRRAGVESEDALRLAIGQCAQARHLRAQREMVQREISAAAAGHCTEEALQRLLETAPERLQAIRQELDSRCDAQSRKLREQYETRGQLAEQLKFLAGQRLGAEKQLELAVVEQRIREAVQRWQILSVTFGVLESIRATYERERQPESLREASTYLQRLTQGRYQRVWTPLGESVLRVDDGQGESWPIEKLSRGTREQLFLALRLALAASYARRGAVLPLVLDDVLVNFDSSRAAAAADVLCDFAAAGHQILVFTCHEHIFRLFKSRKAAAICLPGSQIEESGDETPAAEPPVPRRRTRRPADGSPRPRRAVPLATSPAEPHLAPLAQEEPRADDGEEIAGNLWEEAPDGDPFGDDYESA